MNPIADLYRTPMTLLTDLYQLTMAHGYWKLGRAEQHAVFHLFFRKPPFGGGYAIAGGLPHVIDLLRGFRFEPDDLAYLATLTGNNGRPLFEPGFLTYLAGLRLTCDVDAVPEGAVVFPHEPLVRVRGPILQAQLLETALLNVVNFQTLIATKASRICAAAGGDAVMEFGLRRAQGIDGALSASRAAYLGGCAATSNVLAGKLYGIPVKGTHAHSWVMSFDQEREAFDAYAAAMPHNCVFLVDTYDTLEGVRQAIEVGLDLRGRGHRMVGIRLDSGDLHQLSVAAREMLDDAGLDDAAIVASNDLDEHLIADLKARGATIAVWGVGTRLATAHDQPALGGVYKLAAIQQGDTWVPRVKLSDDPIKTSIPGMLQVKRYEHATGYVADVLVDELDDPASGADAVDFQGRPQHLPRQGQGEPVGDIAAVDLLVPVTRGGEIVREAEPLDVARQRAATGLDKLGATHRRLRDPQPYPVYMSTSLFARRQQLIREAKGLPSEGATP